jgi:hypothetical protein
MGNNLWMLIGTILGEDNLGLALGLGYSSAEGSHPKREV